MLVARKQLVILSLTLCWSFHSICIVTHMHPVYEPGFLVYIVTISIIIHSYSYARKKIFFQHQVRQTHGQARNLLFLSNLSFSFTCFRSINTMLMGNAQLQINTSCVRAGQLSSGHVHVAFD